MSIIYYTYYKMYIYLNVHSYVFTEITLTPGIQFY